MKRILLSLLLVLSTAQAVAAEGQQTSLINTLQSYLTPKTMLVACATFIAGEFAYMAYALHRYHKYQSVEGEVYIYNKHVFGGSNQLVNTWITVKRSWELGDMGWYWVGQQGSLADGRWIFYNSKEIILDYYAPLSEKPEISLAWAQAVSARAARNKPTF